MSKTMFKRTITKLQYGSLTFDFFEMENSDRIGITIENANGLYTDVYIEPEQLRVVSTRNDVKFEPKKQKEFKGYKYIDADGNKAFTWDYEQSIGE
jgi:hypothetical protein